MIKWPFMILDNENNEDKVYEFIAKRTHSGSVAMVTGYFTIGGLAYFAKNTHEKACNYRIVLGVLSILIARKHVGWIY